MMRSPAFSLRAATTPRPWIFEFLTMMRGLRVDGMVRAWLVGVKRQKRTPRSRTECARSLHADHSPELGEGVRLQHVEQVVELVGPQRERGVRRDRLRDV